MRTSIGALNVTTKGYDVVAELEAQGDKYGMAKYIRENAAARKLVSRSDFLSSYGFGNVKRENP